MVDYKKIPPEQEEAFYEGRIHLTDLPAAGHFNSLPPIFQALKEEEGSFTKIAQLCALSKSEICYIYQGKRPVTPMLLLWISTNILKNRRREEHEQSCVY